MLRYHRQRVVPTDDYALCFGQNYRRVLTVDCVAGSGHTPCCGVASSPAHADGTDSRAVSLYLQPAHHLSQTVPSYMIKYLTLVP